jgi:hypothetical protein
MAIMASSAPASCTCQQRAPESPLVVDPAKPPSVEVVLVGHGGKALMPVLVLPGVRVCVDGLSADIDASEWWKDLAVAALYASLCYQGGGIESLR